MTGVQHGVRAVEDPAVLRLAAERDVTFHLCPLSNVGLRVVADMARHPLPKIMAAGVRCTISTDDPLLFGNTMNDEYLAVARGLGFTRPQLVRLARNGFEIALLPAPQKQRWLAQLDAIAG